MKFAAFLQLPTMPQIPPFLPTRPPSGTTSSNAPAHHEITLLPLSFTENSSTHWLLLAIQFDTPTTPIVVLRNPLPTFHSAQALYFARRLLSPISSSIHAFESRSRRQRPLSNDSGPLTFFNAAHICAAIEDDFSLPFPSFIRLRMALAAESFASSSSPHGQSVDVGCGV